LGVTARGVGGVRLERGRPPGLGLKLLGGRGERRLRALALVAQGSLVRDGRLLRHALARLRRLLEIRDARDQALGLAARVVERGGLRQRALVRRAQLGERLERLLGAGLGTVVLFARRRERAFELGHARRRRGPL